MKHKNYDHGRPQIVPPNHINPESTVTQLITLWVTDIIYNGTCKGWYI